MLSDLLDRAIAYYRHLCPHLILGLRMGLAGGQSLGIPLPNFDRRLKILAETNGCAAMGIALATYGNCDQQMLCPDEGGPVAAVFIDTRTGRALRIAPRLGMRGLLLHYAPEVNSPKQIMLLALQRIPSAQLFHILPLPTFATDLPRLPAPLAV